MDAATLEQVLEQREGNLGADGALLFYGFLGQTDRLFAAVIPAVREQRIRIENFWFPELSAVRKDPRFPRLLEQAGLIEYWNEYGWPDLCKPVGDGIVCD